MKNIIIILVILSCIYSCAGLNSIHEDKLYVTRKYCGEFDTMIILKKEVKIYTSQYIFSIPGKVIPTIPNNAKCFIKYIPEVLSGTHSKIWILYFTWDGTEDLYMIKQNYITGEIL